MKLNISNPYTGLQKCIELNDEEKLSIFYGKKMGQDIEVDKLGDEFKGYVLRITGGNDKQGFTMKQGVLVQGRVRLLMGAGHKCYRPRRAGERKRKSVRGCIAGADLSAIALSIVKTGVQDIAGLTDDKKPRRLGPKRATKIRRLFNVKKQEDVRRFVVLYRRSIKKEGSDKTKYKCPKVQRLVTDRRLARKKIFKQDKKERYQNSKKDAEAYHKLVEKVRAEKKAQLAKKRREEKAAKEETAAPKKAEPKKAETKKADTKKADPKKADPKKADTKKADPKKPAKKN